MNTKTLFRLENLPFFGVALTAFLAPLFFIPSLFVTPSFSKSILIVSLVVVSFCLFIISVLKRGGLSVPIGKTYLFTALVPVALLVCALMSVTPGLSLLGHGFEIDTFAFVLVMFVLVFLTAAVFQSEQRLFYGFIAFFASVALLSLYHIVRFIFGADTLSFGMFTSIISTTIGRWYDLGILYGAALLLSLVSIEMFSLNKAFKKILYIFFVLALAFLAIINFSLVWIVLAVLSLVFFVYVFSAQRKAERSTRKMSVISLVVLAISLLFISPLGVTFSEAISGRLGVANIEVRPSWSATVDVSRGVLSQDPVFGVGLSRFSSQWQLAKPVAVNATPFWNLDFNAAVGFIPTFLSTAGIVGFAAWTLFLFFFVRLGFVTLFARSESNFLRYLTTGSFFVALYFWIMLVIYVPSVAIVFLAFFFTGLFFAAAHKEGALAHKEISFAAFPRASFAMVLLCVLVMLASLALGYTVAQKFASAYFFNKGLVAFSERADVEAAEANILKAIDLEENDMYYRGLSGLQIVRLGNIVSGITGSQVSEEVKAEFQRVLGNAVSSAGKAVEIDNTNYQNWIALGKVYDAVTPLGIDKAYENAIQSYMEAITRSPANPEIYLSLARLEASKRDFAKAKEYIAKALVQKTNYSEAIFLRSQIEVAEGNIRAAIASVEGVALISPQDAGVVFELGLLKYNNKDYLGASRALERAVALVPQYANARYFLGLSYDKLGRRTAAIEQFTEISTLNPDNEEVKLILSNLRAGRGPFTNAEPPVDDKPEKRSKLPVGEK